MSRRVPRISLVTSGLGPGLGGIGVVSAGLADALRRDARIRIWPHHANWPRLVRPIALWLRALVGSFPLPDLILFTHVDLARTMLMLPFLRHVPYAVVIHGVEVWRPLDRRRRAALENAAAILANSEFTVTKAREMNAWLPRVTVIWLGAAERAVTVRHSSPPTVLILGRMMSTERYKGHDALIEAWPSVVAAVPAARLVIAGDGDDRVRLQARADQCAGVTFTGFLSDEARDQLLCSASVLVSISTGEGFGLVAVEAAAAGLPIVGIKSTVTEELFPDGCGHVLLDSVAAGPLAEALTRLLTDADLAHSIGEAGRNRMRSTFTLAHFNERVRRAVQPLLATASTS
jgi:phosphatidylinositol alpha-1,6-mannosyltransferase